MTPNENFSRVVRSYAARLAKDAGVPLAKQAPLWGNLGHESVGMTALQERGIKIKDPKNPRLGPGGWSWAQWTGPRRRAFFDYCKANELDPSRDEAAYRFLVFELKNTERKAIPALNGGGSLRDRVVAFELAYERAGTKHYDMRHEWALKADEILATLGEPAPVPPPPDVPPVEKPVEAPRPGSLIAKIIMWLIGLAAVGGAGWLGWGS